MHVMVLIGAGLIVLVLWLSYTILQRRQAGKVSSHDAVNASASIQEIKARPLPTRGVDGQGNPISEDELKSRREYKLGHALGECLSQGCQAFFGIIREIGAAEKKTEEPDEWAIFYHKLMITPDEWLWGDRQQLGSTVQLLYAAKPQMIKSAPGAWSVWEGVDIKVNERIFVARWNDQARKNRSEEIALAVSDQTLATKVSDTVKLHASLKQSAEEMDGTLNSLKDNPDSVVTGYLVGHLTSVQDDVDRAALNLSSLLSVKRLPSTARNDAIRMLQSNYSRLTPERRHTVAEALIAAAADNDLDHATPAILSLISLSDSKLIELESLTGRARRQKIIANYRAAVADGRIDRAAEFESQLGL